MDQTFFDESRNQSVIKARIVANYFWAWAKVIVPTARWHDKRIAYIDLFAGPGRYKDGTTSTPLMVLEKVVSDPDLSQMLVALFNDKDSTNAKDLENAINQLPGIRKLKYRPIVENHEVGTVIVSRFGSMNMIPTFFFVDPWGYKGLSLGLINSVLKNWGCDCVFFFNYNRVSMGLPNDSVREHMNVLFGAERVERLRQQLSGLGSEEREALIVTELSHALKHLGGKYVLPFRFRNEGGTRTTHHLIFVTKHFKGYEIMKEIMAQESSETVEGVATFEYSPSAERIRPLFEFRTPLQDLGKELLQVFAGKTLKLEEVFAEHCVGRPYTRRNYKRILNDLEQAGKIVAHPSAKDRKMYKGEKTFADHVKITFPKEVRDE